MYDAAFFSLPSKQIVADLVNTGELDVPEVKVPTDNEAQLEAVLQGKNF